ncbi:aspartyl-phosphate phosphatase Spo0E family protein [Ammoniphilus resinae]|uniref:Spo0E like sporulation regulatory protein n=1 Tax=Ammoniphilus resinae TaxID=861532 RepID=A0ABS4GW01_9BACL|nr:aspartyl-phosphate phosphatase Spo0E family protein [Ammoniphilus resinae]MBP1934436.1 hypothetical protein [Ammoniphilus resinae]
MNANESTTIKKIDHLKEQLNRVAESHHWSFTDDEVVMMSQQLDGLIVQFMQEKKASVP